MQSVCTKATIIFIILLMLCQIFLSPKVKRCTITYKHGTYEFPHKLPNDLRSWEIGKYKESV